MALPRHSHGRRLRRPSGRPGRLPLVISAEHNWFNKFSAGGDISQTNNSRWGRWLALDGPKSMLLRTTAGLLGTLLMLPSGVVSAQDTTPLDRAREQFAAGVAAADAGDWGTARDAFEAAYELAPRPRILLNLASARIRTEQLVEARADLETFVRTAGQGDDALVAEANRQLDDLRGRTPLAAVRVVGALDGGQVVLDGSPLAPDADLEALALNPGRHEFGVRRDGRSVVSEVVFVGEGERAQVELSMPVATVAVDLDSDPIDEQSGPEIVAPDPSPVVRNVLLGSAAAVVLSFTIGLLIARPFAANEPFVGNVDIGRVALP